MKHLFACQQTARTTACLAAFLCSLVVAGCDRGQITSYQVPKEQPASQHVHGGAPPGDEPHGGIPKAAMPKVKYTLPAGWQEVPGSGMRVASFKIPEKDGQSAEGAIIPLPIAAGGDADVLNFWRSELKLPPLTGEELSRLLQPVEIGAQKGQLLDAVSTETLDDKFKNRMLVAVIDVSGMKWNFRIIGADELVAAQKPAFLEFLKTVSFEAAAAPMAMASGGSAIGAIGGSPLPRWQVPAGWKEQTPGQMLLAAFSVADEKLGSANVTVSSLAGDGGGVLGNLNRWRGQIGLSSLEATALDKETKTVEFNGLKAIVAEALGRDVKGGTGKPTRLIGAMVPHSGETWFFKLMGDDALADKQRDAFLAFVKSVSFDASAPAAATPTPVPPTSAPSSPLLSVQAATGANVTAGLPEWQVPANWKAQAPGPMLLATFAITDSQPGAASTTVSSLAGDGGGLLANINRWRGQVGLGPTEPGALEQDTTAVDLPAGKATLVDLTGPKKTASGNNTRMVAAILPHDGQMWFFKMLGDEVVAGKEKEAFVAFLKSLKFTHAH